jgi:hypothetical protein
MISLHIRSRLGVIWWMSAAVCVSLLLSAAALAAFGPHKRGLDTALMLTGRWGFLLFWPAYAGAGLVALLGDRLGFLKRHGREFGLAFAAAMLVHVGLIGWLCAIGAAPDTGVFLFFGPGLVCIYTLALFSLGGLQRRLGRRSWWLLRTVAMNYIAYAFATDFLSNPFGDGIKHIVLYAPFALLSVLGFAAYGSAQFLLTRKALMAT